MSLFERVLGIKTLSPTLSPTPTQVQVATLKTDISIQEGILIVAAIIFIFFIIPVVIFRRSRKKFKKDDVSDSSYQVAEVVEVGIFFEDNNILTAEEA